MRLLAVKLFVSAFVALGATNALAIRTRPFSVREFKTREIKFKSHAGEDEASERRAAARERRAARERDEAEAEKAERETEERDRNARERELKKQLEENERQQKELQKAREREVAEEWKVYLQELQASNQELKVAIKVAKEEKSKAESSCGMVLSDGRHCPKRALEGKWFCAEHEDPPLPKVEQVVNLEKKSAQTTEAAPEIVQIDAPAGQRRQTVRESPRPKREKVKEKDGDSTLSRWVAGILIGLGIFFVWKMLVIVVRFKG